MGKPTKHRNKWRIRWVDHNGQRQSEVYERYQDAEVALCWHQLEALEVKRGDRSAVTRGKTVTELCDYWLRTRATWKRSPRDDRSIIESHLRPSFGGLPLSGLNVAHLAVELGWLRQVPKIRKPRGLASRRRLPVPSFGGRNRPIPRGIVPRGWKGLRLSEISTAAAGGRLVPCCLTYRRR